MTKENTISIFNQFGKHVSSILHLGGGRVDPIIHYATEFEHQECLIVHVDQGYGTCGMSIEDAHEVVNDRINKGTELKSIFVTADIFEFLDTFPWKFDGVLANRIFEHMFYDSGEVGRLLAATHSILRDGHPDMPVGEMVMIVPNHKKLAENLLNLNLGNSSQTVSQKTLKNILEVNTEFCNTRCDPHGSIWTLDLARYYIQQEGNWTIEEYDTDVQWDGRDCYMSLTLHKKR